MKNGERGIDANYCDGAIINGNNITGSQTSVYSRLIDNYLEDHQTGATINNNTLTMGSVYDSISCNFPTYVPDPTSYHSEPRYMRAIYSRFPIQVSGNTITMDFYQFCQAIDLYNYFDGNGVAADTQIVSDNTIYANVSYTNDEDYPLIGLRTGSCCGTDSRTIIVENNTVNAIGMHRSLIAIKQDGSNFDGSINVLNNTTSSNLYHSYNCSSPSGYEFYRALAISINNVNVVGNTFTGSGTGIYIPSANSYSNIVIDSNYIEAQQAHTAQSVWGGQNTVTIDDDYHYGIYAPSSENIFIRHNTIKTESGTVVYQSGGASTIKYNLLESWDGRGLHVENQAGTEFSSNTITSLSQNGGDFGIHVSNLSAPVIKNNIINNFQSGIYLENSVQNFSVQYNDLWNISGADYSGSAIAPLIGDYNSSNNNGDASDIYGNISLDPLFDNSDTNVYALQFMSPCINGGDPNDPLESDYTIVDIGAFPFYDPPIFGCVDSIAFNFDSLATMTDSSCCYLSGCLDTIALNYDALACFDDGNCCYISGCTSTNAFNYDSTACFDDGSCNYIMPGCMDSIADNYNPIANLDDGSCYYCDLTNSFFVVQNQIGNCNGAIVANSNSSNGPITYLWSNGSTSGTQTALCFGIYTVVISDTLTCSIEDTIYMGIMYGCMDSTALNYDALANTEDGSCCYAYGCMDTLACNYDPLATCDDGSCLTVYGCTDSSAFNYDALATCDDGGCLYCDLNTSFFVVENTPEQCDGIIIANSTSTYEPISYSWSNGSTSNTLSDLCLGTYIVQITDDVGCSSTDTVYMGVIFGCIDSLALNYDTLANTDDGSCCYAYGCMDTLACNYDPIATCDDGSCLTVYGCTDSLAFNYDALATCDDGSCLTCDLTTSHVVVQNTPGVCDGIIVSTSTSSFNPITYLWSNGSTLDAQYGLCFGMYSVVITDSLGCSIEDTIN
jgi:parallel beta-helix repeat protein